MENRLSRWVSRKRNNKVYNSTSDSITLVKGHFSPPEAADVLLTLINDKIKFHSIQILKLHEGSEKDITCSEERIKDLKEAKSKITEMVVEAHNKGLLLEINSSIDVRMHPRSVNKDNNP